MIVGRCGALYLALLSLTCCACASSSEGGTDVRVVSAGVGLNEGEALATAAGGRLRVDALRWTTSEVELVSCRSAWQRVADWLVPSAHAHGTSTPTLVASPRVERLNTSVELPLGDLEPPAGNYCGLRVRLAPADADAHGLEESPDMLGRSLFLQGAFLGADGDLEPYTLSSSIELDIDGAIDLELSRARTEATIRLRRDLALEFQRLDFDALTPVERDAVILQAFAASLRIEVY